MAVALLISDDGHVTNIGTRSWRRQRLAALAAGGFLFAFGLHLGFYVAREPSIYKSRPWGPSNTHVGSQSSPAILPSHDEPSSPDLHTNSSFQPSGSNPVNGACLAYPFPDLDVVIVVKTGATEALNRIPTQLLTFLSFAKDDVSIFSDMVQKIGKSHVYDAIVDVVDEARIVNSDFELYEMQKQVKMFGEDISSLSKGEEANEQHSPFWPPNPDTNDYDTPAVTTCARLCRETPDCFQYLWNGTSCKLSTKFFSLGGMKEVENEEKGWVSGWDLERVKDFQSKNGHCGSGLWEYHE